MPTRISTALKINRRLLNVKGIYDSMIDFDSKLHIDPATLANCEIPEFRNASKKVILYFADVLTLISASKKINDPFWKVALKKLTFGEGLSSGLGYSQKGTHGSGIGPEMAKNILVTVKLVVEAGINDPKIFELVPILEDKIGPDRISDMISIILKDEFFDFTNRIAGELNVKPLKDSKGNIIIFVPKSILNDLPIAAQWEDVAISVSYNEKIRGSLNKLIGQSWRKIANENKKSTLKELLLKHPDLLRELLIKYKARSIKGYDFILDHLGITIFDVLGPETALDFPLDLKKFDKVTSENVLDILRKITQQYKKLIEDNGLVSHLYDGNLKLRPERFPQLLFYSIADSYCSANGLDLNREINAGSGALDFKISMGLAKVTLEIKYSSNPKLVEGFTKQLKTYNDSEGIDHKYSIYLVLRINPNMDHKLTEIQSIIAENRRLNTSSPELIVIDASIKPSASLR
ncbi:hypothetical protein [Pedobacter sp. UYP1]|uniref:hypothetical protein n=1 Tax=Pedobacter sp. UYP1 TaxID=1756396 RepID=UPI00339669F4